MTVHGSVAPGFEPVRDLLEASLGDLGQGGAAYAVYHRGQPVVDLWAGDATQPEGGDGTARAWQEDTTALFMSTAKAVTAFCCQLLHERGVVDVYAPVAKYWPEFTAAGKAEVTVAQVLTHTSGVVGSPELSALFDLDAGTGFEQHDEIAAAIAAATPMWAPGSQPGYHTMTFGWILDEVIRRADGRDLGTFFREEVALPLDCDDVYIGTPPEEHHRIATVLPLRFPPAVPDEVRTYMDWFLSACRDDTTPGGVSCLARDGAGALDRLPQVFNNAPARTAPLGGSNLCGTARSVARVFAAIAEPDGLDGTRLSSPEALATFSAEHEARVDVVMGIPLSRGLGYNRNVSLVPGRPPTLGPNDATVGHSGVGGQVGFADPVARVGSAFVRSDYTVFPVLPMLLTSTLYQCLPA